MNNQIITLYQQHENELKATIPDFAHQLEQLLKIKPKQIIYSDKSVAEYEQEIYEDTTDDKLHPDFEENVGLLSQCEEDTINKLFIQHFDDDLNYSEQIALLSDTFSNKQLNNFVEKLQYIDADGVEMDDLTDKPIPKGKSTREKKKEAEKQYSKRRFGRRAPIRRSLHEEEIEVDLDKLKLDFDYDGHEIDTDTKGQCGKKKKKEPELIKPLQYCDTCEFEHADHFRLCANCNEEHDGCCEILA